MIGKITVLFNHVATYCIQLDESTRVVRTSNNQVHGCCNIVVQSCYFIIPCMTTCSIMYEHGCWFIMMVPTTLFKSVCSSSHEQSVPTCMNKPVNNHVQAGQLNHVQDCQQAKTSYAFYVCILNAIRYLVYTQYSIVSYRYSVV